MIKNEYIVQAAALLEQRYPDRMPMAHLHSFGCQQNVNDGEKIMGLLALIGYGFCDSPFEADIVIYNTCAVREHAETKLFGNVGELKAIKATRPDMIIGLCGCMPQQEHITEKIKQSYRQVDLVFGTHVIQELPQMLCEVLSSGTKRIFNIDDTYTDIVEGMPVRREHPFKANLPIMYGCNNFCTYCIVPYVRGRERSRLPEHIEAEFRELVAEGYKEITLLGQNVNSYGKGLVGGIDFAHLLRRLNAIDGGFRIRFMTSHPRDATHELFDAMADCDKVCGHIHLPVQSGSDRILNLMNRHYNVADYLSLVEYARKCIPDIAITSDIIVGFPGEQYDDFRETLELIRTVRFDSLFSFIYSKRNGTKAAEMADTVPYADKSRWFRELLDTQRGIGSVKYRECVGQTYRVLVDGEGRMGEGYLTGRSDNYSIVDFKGTTDLIGQFVDVRITEALNWALLGEPV